MPAQGPRFSGAHADMSGIPLTTITLGARQLAGHSLHGVIVGAPRTARDALNSAWVTAANGDGIVAVRQFGNDFSLEPLHFGESRGSTRAAVDAIRGARTATAASDDPSLRVLVSRDFFVPLEGGAGTKVAISDDGELLDRSASLLPRIA